MTMEIYYYTALFLISIVLTIVYAAMWHKHFSVHYTLVFTIIPIALLGYLKLAEAQSLEAAVFALKISYLGGCYLLLFVLLSVLNLCNISYRKTFSIALIVIMTLIYLSVLSIGIFPIFYKSVSYVDNGGYVRLVKEYGPIHTAFIVMLLLLLILNMFAIIYSYRNKKDVSDTTIVLLFIVVVISVMSYFISKSFLNGLELTPLTYIFDQILFLIIAHRICMYDITDSAIDSIVQTGDTGIISLDFKYRYLGSNKTAMNIIPELYNIKIDTSIEKEESLKKLLIPWIETFVADESDDKFYLRKGDRTYIADINYLYNGDKKRGYQFLLTDDTKNQEYIALINNYNADLKREVDLKTAHIKEMSDRLILDMAIMVESRDNSTGGHIRRTADCVRLIVNEIKKDNRFGVTAEFFRNVIKAAPMHDLGKIAVDDAILRKPGRFTDEEFEKMKKHAAEGARIVHEVLRDTDDAYFHQIAENVAHYHHERWDGSGYPEGLKGDDIPLEARIMAIADVYDALVSKRVYKDSMSFEQADSIIMESMGRHFDKRLEPYYVAARSELEKYYTGLGEE